jgi:hypothetical protein
MCKIRYAYGGINLRFPWTLHIWSTVSEDFSAEVYYRQRKQSMTCHTKD